jgi:hypothetical protein
MWAGKQPGISLDGKRPSKSCFMHAKKRQRTPDSMKKPFDELMKGAQGKEVFKRLTSVDVLVIDEISMIENLQFERLNMLMKHARGKGPFGGVQIIVTGDVSKNQHIQRAWLTYIVLSAVTRKALPALHRLWLGTPKRQRAFPKRVQV